MQAKLKRLHSPDISDLENHTPESANKFSILLQAMIGPADQEGEESFDIEVCTPQWLENVVGQEEVLIGRHLLVVREYNYQRIIRSIENFLNGCTGETWNEVAAKVSRLGRWEFEDYVA